MTALLKHALESFIQSPDFMKQVINCTIANRNGEYYAVILFEDGNYRVDWSVRILNGYQSPVIILILPTLTDDLESLIGTSEESFIEECKEEYAEELRSNFSEHMLLYQ